MDPSFGLLFSSCCLLLGVVRGQEHGATPPEAKVADPLVARVGQQEIHLQELLAEVNRLIPLSSFHRRVSPERLLAIRRQAFDRLVERSLVHQDAIARGIAATDAELDERLRKALDKAGPEYRDVSAARFADLRRRFRLLLVRDVLVEKNEARFAASIPVPDDAALQEVYARLLAEGSELLRPPREAHLLYLYFAIDPSNAAADFEAKKRRAEAACEELGRGTAFAEVARRYSDDPSAERGGDLGVVKMGSLRSRELDEVAFALAPGETSSILRSIHGYHVFRCVGVEPARIYSAAEIKPMLTRWFVTGHTRERRVAWMAELRGRYPIEVVAPDLIEPGAAAPGGGDAGAGGDQAGCSAGILPLRSTCR